MLCVVGAHQNDLRSENVITELPHHVFIHKEVTTIFFQSPFNGCKNGNFQLISFFIFFVIFAQTQIVVTD